MNQKQRKTAIYILLAAIILLSGTLLLILKTAGRGEAEPVPPVRRETPSPRQGRAQGDEPEISERGPAGSEAEAHSREEPQPGRAPGPGSKGKPSLTIIIDDVGNNLKNLDRFLEFPGPLTFAVMPRRRYTREAAEKIHAAGKTVILHQPMEPLGGLNPGPGAIYAGMTDAEIRRILQENLADVPHAVGVNNHMGSKITTSPREMGVILDYLKSRGIFYIDSYTAAGIVGEGIAERLKMPYIKRNSMFLDNEKDRGSIEKALNEGMNTARKNGHAVMIGHIVSDELAELLLEIYPDFIEEGYSLKDISELFIDMFQGKDESSLQP